MRYWLGPWVWRTGDGIGPRWDAPTGTLHRLDLRSLPQQGTPGPVALGHGLFVTDDATALGADYLEVPESFNALARNRIRTKLGLSQTVLAAGRRGLLLELLTRHADVSGTTFARPLMPNRRGRLRLAFANLEVDEDHEITLASPFWAKVQTALQEQYREYRRRALNSEAPPDFHRKWLSTQLEKFAGRITDYRVFIPSDLPDESPLPHSTVITESFNKADNGLGPDLTWTNVAGTWVVRSNAASESTGNDNVGARAESDLATSDLYVVADVSSPFAGNRDIGVAGRFSSSANTYYGHKIRIFTSEVFLFKLVTGTFTQLDVATVTPAMPDPIRLECNGSTIDGYYNGSLINSATDTAITGNTRCGLCGFAISTGQQTADNWEAADLAAGVTITPGVGSLVATGYAPTVLIDKPIAVAVGSVVATGYAPTVAADKPIAVGVGSVVATGLAPSLQLDQRIDPGVGSGVFTGYAPTVSSSVLAAPGVGSVVATGYAPDLQRTYLAQPASGSGVFTGLAPTISVSASVVSTPAVGTVSATGYAPTLAIDKPIAIGLGSGVITGYAPTTLVAYLVTPSAGTGSFTGYAPTMVTGDASIIDLTGSEQPVIDVAASYQTVIDVAGSYQTVIDITGSVE